MNKKNQNLFHKNFDYEEDDYDRYKDMNRNSDYHKSFTNKANFKKIEFDYEEDPYEPEKVK